jgi:hypothetical protein
MIFLFINAVFVVLCWKWAEENFQADRKHVGWLYIMASAANAAIVASELF